MPPNFSDARKIASSHGQMAGQTCTRWFPIRPASRVCSRSWSRSKVTWYGDFCDVTKLPFSCRQIAGAPPNCLLYSTVSRSVSTCAHFMKHHYTLLPCSISIRQLDLMSKSWNELIRHWRSSFTFALSERIHYALPPLSLKSHVTAFIGASSMG